MKILVTVPHYFETAAPQISARHSSLRGQHAVRRTSFTACLESLTRLRRGLDESVLNIAARHPESVDARKIEVDIVVCTTSGRHLLAGLPLSELRVEHRETTADPGLLGYECHDVLSARSEDYDYFAYVEDDLVIEDPDFIRKLMWFNQQFSSQDVLQPHRFEHERTRKMYIDGDLRIRATAPYQNVCDRPVLQGSAFGRDLTFRRALNPHSGCFFLSREQMQMLLNGGTLGTRSTAFVSGLESAATLHLMQTFRVYKTASPEMDFLTIRHADKAFLQTASALQATRQKERNLTPQRLLDRMSSIFSSPRRNRAPRARRSQNTGTAAAAVSAQILEKRQLLTVTAEFSSVNNRLDVTADAGETLELSDAGGIMQLLVNGAVHPIEGDQPNTVNIERIRLTATGNGHQITVDASGTSVGDPNGDGLEIITGGGDDTITLRADGSNVPDRQVIRSGAGNDTIRLLGNNGALIDAGAGDDTITGSGSADTLRGGEGDDRINGLLGDDVIDGDGGFNTLAATTFDSLLITASIDSSGNGVLEGSGTKTLQSMQFLSIEGSADNERIDLTEFNGAEAEINGGAGNDTIIGSRHRDLISGGEGNDSVDGGDGDDQITGNEGEDTLFGGDGNDLIVDDLTGFVNSNDLLFGGDGQDTLRGGGGNDELNGGNGDDTLDGGAGEDFLGGDAGDDSLAGGANDDTVSAGIGNDIADGGTGNDRIFGGPSQFGFFQSDNDLLFGGDGDDTINGGGGNDSMAGGEGNDLLDGDEGDNRLAGSEGDDTLSGGTEGGSDHLEGQEGSDTYLFFATSGEDTIVEDRETETAGIRDTVDFSNITTGSPLLINLSDTVPVADVGVSTRVSLELPDIEAITGTALDDVIENVLAREIVRVEAGPGNDTVTGGDDQSFLESLVPKLELIGGDGEDQLTAGDRIPTLLDGGRQNDRLETGENSADSVTLAGGKGDDILQIGAGRHQAFGGEGSDAYQFLGTLPDEQHDHLIQDVSGEFDGVDFQRLGGNVGLMVQLMLPGAAPTDLVAAPLDSVNPPDFRVRVPQAGDAEQFEFIIGTTADDHLTGHDGDNTLLGSSGDDTLIGLGGDDSVIGGGGADTISYQHAPGPVFVRLHDNLPDGGLTEEDRLASVENIIGSEFTDILEGNAAANRIDGLGENDLLNGFGESDTLIGGDGDDEYVFNTPDQEIENDLVFEKEDGDDRDTLNFSQLERINNQEPDLRVFLANKVGLPLAVHRLRTIEAVRPDNATDAFAEFEIVVGSEFDDLITGNELENTLIGGNGDDVISGLAEVDSLIGGDGDDEIRAGEGNGSDPLGDTLVGGDGRDTLIGGTDDDFLDGGEDADTLSGGLENDVLRGGPGDDELLGDGGNDALVGGAGEDTFIGGSGNDVFVDASIDVAVVRNNDEADPLFVGDDTFYDMSLTNLFSAEDAANNVRAEAVKNGAISGPTEIEDQFGEEFVHPITGQPTGVFVLPVGVTEFFGGDDVIGSFPGIGTNTISVTFDKRQTDTRLENNTSLEPTTVLARRPDPPRITSAPGGGITPLSLSTELLTGGIRQTGMGLSSGSSYQEEFQTWNGLPTFNTDAVDVFENITPGSTVVPGQAVVGDPILLNALPDGTPGNGASRNGIVSADGTLAGFTADSTNLVSGVVNGVFNAWLRNMETGEIELISRDKDGGAAADGDSEPIEISADGRYVLFRSDARNLTELPVNNVLDQLYLRDRQNGTTIPVTRSADGLTMADNAVLNIPDMSPDGRFVTYTTTARNLTNDGDTANFADIFLFDRDTGTTTLLSTTITGGLPVGDSTEVRITDDASRVYFLSTAPDLTNLPRNNGGDDLYYFERGTGEIHLVSVNAAGTATGNGANGNYDVSGDGRYVTWFTIAGDLVPGFNLNNQITAVLRDTVSETTEYISLNSADQPAEGFFPQVSDDGRFVAFQSSASLVAGDQNGVDDVYVRDRLVNTTSAVSVNSSGQTGNGPSDSPRISDDGEIISFVSAASDLTDTIADLNNTFDFFISDRHSFGITDDDFVLSVNLNDAAGADVRIETQDGRLLLTDQRSGALLASRPLNRIQFVEIIGQDNIDDTLTLDFSESFPDIPNGIVFRGGAGGNDSLNLTGGRLDATTYTADGPDRGTMFLENTATGVGTQTLSIRFDGLEPVIDANLSPLRTFVNATPGDTNIQIAASGAANIRIDDPLAGAFESIEFPVPDILRIFGNESADTITAASLPAAFVGELQIDAAGGNDRIDLSAVHVTSALTDGTGDDQLLGGPGDTRYIIGAGGTDSLVDTSGLDTLDFSGAANTVTFDPDLQNVVQNLNLAARLTVQGQWEQLIGTTGDDTFSADAVVGIRTIDGGPGNDTLQLNTNGLAVTRAGDDFRFSHGGELRTVNMEQFREEALIIELSDQDDDVFLTNPGDGTVVLEDINGTLGGDQTIVVPAGGLVIRGGGGDDIINAEEADFPVVLEGGEGDDELVGGTLDDTLLGGNGNDVLIGNQGADTQRGGADDDEFRWNNGDGPDDNFGESGRDRLEFNGSDAVADQIILTDASALGDVGDGTHSAPEVKLTRTSPSSFTIELGGIEETVVNGQGGNDDLNAAALPAGLTTVIFNGGAGDDLLVGSDGEDQMTGAEGDDRLIGNKGIDTIFGDVDFIFGALLPAGNDTFVWNNGDGADNFDGERGQDTLIFNGAAVNDSLRLAPASDVGAAGDGDLPNADIDITRTAPTAFTIETAGLETFIVNGQGGDDTLDATLIPASLGVLTELHGGPGNDRLLGSGADDLLFGGAGNDLLQGRGGDDRQHGGGGDDRFIWNNGDGADDNLGEEGSDFMFFFGANSGDDQIGLFRAASVGLRGDGTLPEAEIDITRFAPSGFTIETGGIETFTVDALAGNDVIDATKIPAGLLGRLILRGSTGDDRLFGSGSADRLIGGPGNDLLQGRGGADVQSGGTGNDLFIWNNGDGADDNIGGEGDDFFRFLGDRIAGDSILMTPAGVVGAAGDETLRGASLQLTRNAPSAFTIEMGTIENVTIHGLGGDDRLDATTLSNGKLNRLRITGGDGNDTLFGSGGVDDLRGGRGSDLLQGRQGNDFLAGDEGDDQFVWNNGDGADDAAGGQGRDFFSFLGSNTGDDHVLLNPAGVPGGPGEGTLPGASVEITRVAPSAFSIELAAVEVVTLNGLGGNDQLDATQMNAGRLQEVILRGGSGNDTLIGSAGVDTILGGEGNDLLLGRRGADRLLGQAGDDLFLWNNGDGADDNDGGSGQDFLTFNGAPTADDVVELRPAADVGESGDGTLPGAVFDLTRTAPSAFTIENTRVEIVTINGLGGDDNLRSDAIPVGLLQTVILRGGRGNDVLIGGDSGERLFGGADDDILQDGRGNDFLDGGTGDDRFQLLPDGFDAVQDEAGQDTLDFRLADRPVTVDPDRRTRQIVDDAGNELLLLIGPFENVEGDGGAENGDGFQAARSGSHHDGPENGFSAAPNSDHSSAAELDDVFGDKLTGLLLALDE